MTPEEAVVEVEIVDVALRQAWTVAADVKALGMVVFELVQAGAAGESLSACDMDRGDRITDMGREEEAQREEERCVHQGFELL